jgi:O-antigen/teichoic acid export membrane protein
VFGFVAMSYLFRTLPRERYGIVETTVAVMMFGLISVEMGLGTLGTREVARDPSAAPALVRKVATTQLVSAFSVLTLIVIAAWALPIDPLLSHLLVGFGIGLLAIPFALHWLFQGREQMLAVTLPKGLRYAVFLALTLVLVRGPQDLALLPIAEVAGAAAASLAWVAVYRRGGGELRIGGPGALDGRLVRDALPIGGATLIWAVRSYLPVVCVAAIAGNAAAGDFGASLRIVMVMIGVLDVYFINLYPKLCVAAVKSRGDLRRLVGHSMHLAVWPTLAGAAALPWLAPWILRIVFGNEDAESAAQFALLAWIVPIAAIRAHSRFTLFAVNRQRWEFLYSMVGVIALVALLVPLTASHGAKGAIWAMLLSEILATILGWAVLLPHLRRDREDPFSATGGDPMIRVDPAGRDRGGANVGE